jgi:hypothetical protein
MEFDQVSQSDCDAAGLPSEIADWQVVRQLRAGDRDMEPGYFSMLAAHVLMNDNSCS